MTSLSLKSASQLPPQRLEPTNRLVRSAHGPKRSMVSAIRALPKIVVKNYLFELILDILYLFHVKMHAKTFQNVFTNFCKVKFCKKGKKRVGQSQDSNPQRWLGRDYRLPLITSCPDALAGYATKSLEINSGFLPSYPLVQILANRKAVNFTFQPKKYKFQIYP